MTQSQWEALPRAERSPDWLLISGRQDPAKTLPTGVAAPPLQVIKAQNDRMVSHNLKRTLDNNMTIQSDSQKPEMTYSKSRSLVALVTGTMTTMTTLTFLTRTLVHTWPLVLCFSLHETEEDGPERLHSAARRKLLRLQAVSTSLTTVVMEKKERGFLRGERK